MVSGGEDGFTKRGMMKKIKCNFIRRVQSKFAGEFWKIPEATDRREGNDILERNDLLE